MSFNLQLHSCFAVFELVITDMKDLLPIVAAFRKSLDAKTAPRFDIHFLGNVYFP